MDAIAWLTDAQQEQLHLLLDVPRPDPNSPRRNTVDSACQQFLDRYQKACRATGTVFVDFFDIDPELRMDDGMHPVDWLLPKMRESERRVCPVIGLDRDDKYIASALAQSSGIGIAIRLLPDDISVPTLSLPELNRLIESNNVNRSDTDLILDFRSVVDRSPDALAQEVVEITTWADAIDEYRSIFMIGSGLPMNYSKYVPAGTDGYLPRTEWKAWDGVRRRRSDTDVDLVYGDYGIVHPDDMDKDIRVIAPNIGPKVRYALKDEWYILRGHAFSQHPKKGKQYFDLARAVINHEAYMGESFSEGDARVMRKAKELEGPGQPRQWVSIDTNHHIAVTLSSLSELGQSA